MIVSIHQPSFLPWLGYFHRIALSDLHIILDTVQFARGKDSFINRNKIRTPQGWMWLTVPVSSPHIRPPGGGNPPISETRIANATPWAKKHRNALETSYRGAPFWDQYGHSLLALYETHWELLSPMNLAFTRWCLDQLGIKTRIRLASELHSDKQKSDLVLDLSRKVGATTYISGALGRRYLDEESFQKAGIRLLYQDYHHPVYPQRFEPFVPYMSIVDLLMNCGPDSLTILMGREELGLVLL
ncbi:MAG: WbqC family protein [Armatimonadetes bacterium]|nr:WbqC family protein [Armatimonadota bacterium]